jgi:hypothetical protein
VSSLKSALVIVVLGFWGVGVSLAFQSDPVKPKTGTWEGTAKPLPPIVPKGESNVVMKVGKKRVKRFQALLRHECKPPRDDGTVDFALNTRDFDGKGKLSGQRKPRFGIFAPVSFAGSPGKIYVQGKFVSKRKAKGTVKVVFQDPGCETSTGRREWVARP